MIAIEAYETLINGEEMNIDKLLRLSFLPSKLKKEHMNKIDNMTVEVYSQLCLCAQRAKVTNIMKA